MAIRRGSRSASAWLLSLALIVAVSVFGVPARYTPSVSITLTAAQLLLMGGAASCLAIPAWRSGDERRRAAVVSGLLLILPWALLTLMPGYGPPFASSLAMNHERFVILFASTASLGAGLWTIKDSLARGETDDRLLAPLGQISALMAVCIQLVWAAMMIGWTMSEAHRPTDYLPLYGTPLGNAADVLLFFAGLLTYVATGFYALSFARQGWIRRNIAWVIVIVVVAAIIALLARGLQYPDLPDRWYSMPGMIVGIPAVPWTLTYVLGVFALLRAARP